MFVENKENYDDVNINLFNIFKFLIIIIIIKVLELSNKTPELRDEYISKTLNKRSYNYWNLQSYKVFRNNLYKNTSITWSSTNIYI